MATATSSFDLEDERRLNLTQQTRENIVSMLTAKGLPEDKEDRAFLLSALDGLDRTTLSKARIKTDAAANKSNEETASLVASLLAKVVPAAIANNQQAVNRQAPALAGEFKVLNPVEGETEVGAEPMTYDDFMQKMENE